MLFLTVLNHREIFQKFKFHRLVLDEGHHIKNEATATAKTVLKIKKDDFLLKRIYMSGTPVTNHAKTEIIAVKHFVQLSYLSLAEVADQSENPSEWVQPLLIRRVKGEKYPDTGELMVPLQGMH